MKIIYLIILIFLISDFQKSECGKYSYGISHFYEDIELCQDNKFMYNVNFNFSQYQVKGNYHILNDSLILNSYPQKERIIVFETNKGKMQNVTFEVLTKNNQYFNYNIILILNNDEEIHIVNQWKKTKLKKIDIKGFYIVDKNGLKSPKYIIIGKFTNYYKILFESSRVFENESWGITKNKITPRGFNGKLQNYCLEKN